MEWLDLPLPAADEIILIQAIQGIKTGKVKTQPEIEGQAANFLLNGKQKNSRKK